MNKKNGRVGKRGKGTKKVCNGVQVCKRLKRKEKEEKNEKDL